MATFEEWQKELPDSFHDFSTKNCLAAEAAYHAGAASRDAELRELGPCGKHPKTCWVEDKNSLSHLDSFYRSQIDKGMFNEDQVDSLRKDNSHCTACAETADLRSKIEAALAEVYDLRARGANSDQSINILYREWANRMEAALGKQGEGR